MKKLTSKILAVPKVLPLTALWSQLLQLRLDQFTLKGITIRLLWKEFQEFLTVCSVDWLKLKMSILKSQNPLLEKVKMKRRYFVLSSVSFGLVIGCTYRKTKDSPQPSVELSTNSVPPAIANVTEPIFTENGVAIRGADPVAYFEVGQPVIGNQQFTHNWMGVNWWFSSAGYR